MYLTGDTAEAAGTAGPASGPSAGLYLTEPARGLAGLAFLPLAAPWLATAPRGDGHGVLVAPGLSGHGHEHGPAPAVPAPARLRRARLGSRAQPGPVRSRAGRAAAGAGGARRAHRRPGVGDRLEPGRDFRQGAGAPASRPGPPGHHPGQPVRAHRPAAEPGRWRLPPPRVTCTRTARGCPRASRSPGPIGVPSTAVYSRRDGIVAWQTCVEPETGAARERRGPLRAPRLRHRSRDAVADRRPARRPGRPVAPRSGRRALLRRAATRDAERRPSACSSSPGLTPRSWLWRPPTATGHVGGSAPRPQRGARAAHPGPADRGAGRAAAARAGAAPQAAQRAARPRPAVLDRRSPTSTSSTTSARSRCRAPDRTPSSPSR